MLVVEKGYMESIAPDRKQLALELGKGGKVEIDALRSHPLLVLDNAFIFRRTFDAACRLAGFEPYIRFESRGPHTLLAMAESGNGVAIVPSALRTRRYAARVVGVMYQGQMLREPLTSHRFLRDVVRVCTRGLSDLGTDQTSAERLNPAGCAA